MIFVLGFAAAGLLALACLPAVWRRALRLTDRRLRQLVPLSDEEIVAERDTLRATFAVEQRRLEQKLDRSEAARSTLLADLGRRDAAIAALDRQTAEGRARNAALTGERDATQRELHEVRAGVGAAEVALYDATGLAETRRWAVLDAEGRVHDLENTVDQGRATIAALETRVMGLESRLSDLNQTLGGTRAELARTVEAVGRAVAERDAARRAVEAAPAAEAPGAELPDPAATRALDAERQAVETAQALAAQRATIAELHADRLSLEAQLAMRAEAYRATAQTLEVLRSESETLRRTLADLDARPAATEADVAILRDAIRQVADDVLRGAAGGHEPPPASRPAEVVLPSRPN